MATKKSSKNKIAQPAQPVIAAPPQRFFRRLRNRMNEFLLRRPHRSFRRTRRRDYIRSLQLPGYWSFSLQVQKTLWAHRRLFIGLIVVYAVLSALIVGIASQATYTTLTDTIKTTSGGIFNGNLGALGQASLLFASTISGSLTQSLTQAQQTYAVLLGLMAWLTCVWILRNVLAGNKVKLRDGLYSSGSPLLATFLVSILLVVQLLPMALAFIGYSAATSTGLLNNGIEGLLFWVAAGMLVILSLYWITSTIFALVIVTLPGMYPMRAIRTAGDLVVGRRLRILLRFLWMVIGVIVTWTVIMIPIILIDGWIKGIFPAIQAVPTVPVSLLILSSLTVVWIAAYVYLFYRKVVADDASPA